MPGPTSSRLTATPSVRTAFASPRSIGIHRAKPCALSGSHTNFNGRT